MTTQSISRLALPLLVALATASCAGGSTRGAAASPQPLKALLVIGGKWHDYGAQKDLLKDGLERRANVQIDVAYSPDKSESPHLPILGDADYAKGYDVVIHDECAASIADPTVIRDVLAPHRAGIPGVNLHCAVHSYRIGDPNVPAALGTERARWFEYLGVQSSDHGDPLPITIHFTDEASALTQGLREWTTGNEELYNNVQVFGTIKPWARGTQTVTEPDGTQHKDDFVLAWTNDYHGVRVFNITLGHEIATVADPRYLDLVARGVLWACGKLDSEGQPVKGYGPGAVRGRK